MEPLLPKALGHLEPGELFVHEFFLSIQGESTHAGRPCFFIRLAGCHLRCTWCDTEYAFHAGEVRTVSECVDRALASRTTLVEVTGGEPLLQKSTPDLLRTLADRGFEVLLETNGALPVDRVDSRVRKIVDWKCPSSGMQDRNHPLIPGSLRAGDELKFVICGREDYEWARAWVAENLPRLPKGIPLLFSPVTGRLRAADLAAWILGDAIPVRLNLQLHKLVWDPTARGV